MANKKDLEILVPDNEVVMSNGEVVVIRPFAFVQLPKVISLLNNIGSGVMELFSVRDNEENHEEEASIASQEIKNTILTKLNSILSNHFDEVAEIMAIYCNKPKEFFLDENGPTFEEACEIILTIIERHYSFFTKRLQPIMERLQKKK